MNKTRICAAIALAAFSILHAPETARAATATWSGAGADNNWQTAANWGGTAPVPATTMDLIFGGSTRLSPNNDFTAASSFGSLSFASGAGAFALGGNSITLNGDILNSSANSQTVSLGVALSSGYHALTNANATTLTLGGSMSRVTGATMNFSTVGTFNGAGLLSLVGTSVGGWATIGGTEFAISDGTKIAATTYTSVSGSQTGASATAQNWKTTGTTTLTASATINSLNQTQDFTVGAGVTLTLGSGGLILGSTERWLLGSGTIKSGLANGELYIHANTTGLTNGFRIHPIIADGSVASAVTKDGPGQVQLQNTGNTFSGGFYLNGGSVYVGGNSVGSPGSLTSGPLGTGAVTLNSGTLNLWGAGTTSATLGNGVSLVGPSAAINANSGYASTLSGVISGSGPLTKTGAGTLILSGANTYSGNTTISAGTLLVTGTLGSGANYGGAIANSGLLYISNSANQTLSGASASLGSVFKQGEGTLTLSANNTFNGSGAGGFPVQLQGGRTIMSGGTQTVSGELVLGGVIANGGAGTNSSLLVSGSAALNVNGWLSIGRGNGVGVVSSDLILSNSAAVTAANMSAGYDGGNAANLPKGSITLNDTSSLTITGNGAMHIGESTGSQITLTLNGASVLTATGTGTKDIGGGGTGILAINGTSAVNFGTNNAYVGYRNGTGTLTMSGGTLTAGNLYVGGTDANAAYTGTGTANISGGTVNVANLTMARGNNNQSLNNGTTTVSGGTVNANSWLVLGFAGAGNLGKLVVSGGTVNASGNMLLHQYDTANAQLDVSSGSLNLLNNAPMLAHPSFGNGTGTATINQTGGNITFYSDAGTTVGGTGVLDMQGFNSAGDVTTYNLDGGTLTVPRVISTQTSGTRVFNFNGGTLAATTSTNAFFNLGAGAVANVRNGGAIINDNGKAVTIAQVLAHSSIGGDNATDGGLTKSGNGTVTLTGANTLNGAVAVNAGTLYANAANAANNAALSYVSGITVAGGATLRSSANALFGWDGSQDKPITVSLNGTLVADNGADVGVSTVTLAGGTLASDGTSAFWGSWRFDNAGDKLVVTENSTVTAANVKFANGGAIDVNAGKLLAYNSAITDLNAAGGGTVSVVKEGAGTVVLAAANTYTGATTVNGGTVKVNGSLASAVTLNSTATLGGSGSIGGLTLASGSTVSPGNSPGTLTINGNTSWLGGANYNWQIVAATGTAGTGWDLISATGTLDLSALTPSSKFSINLWSLASTGPDVNGNLTDFSGASNYTWKIASAAGGITGFSAANFNINVASANGTTGFSNSLVGPNGTGSFSVALGGAGNTDLNLVYSAAAPVPEPGTWAAAALLAGGAAFARWRKRKVS